MAYGPMFVVHVVGPFGIGQAEGLIDQLATNLQPTQTTNVGVSNNQGACMVSSI